MTYKRFTEIEIAKMRQCHAEGMTAVEAAKCINRLPNSVLVKGRQLGIVFAKVSRAKPSETVSIVKHIMPKYIRPASLTGWLMGDPPIGRSALDQKRGQA